MGDPPLQRGQVKALLRRGLLSVENLLRAPKMRGIDVPRYMVFDPPSLWTVRWKRVRQWAFEGDPVLLPWLGFNASGSEAGDKNLNEDSPTGQTMVKLAYNWGFDGLATYNVLPIEGGSSKKVIANVEQKITTDPAGWDEELSANFSMLAADLATVDALVVAWGNRRDVAFFLPLLTRLFTLLDGARAPSTWAFDRNRRNEPTKTTPRHAYLSADAHSFDFSACKPAPFPRELFLKARSNSAF